MTAFEVTIHPDAASPTGQTLEIKLPNTPEFITALADFLRSNGADTDLGRYAHQARYLGECDWLAEVSATLTVRGYRADDNTQEYTR